MKALQKHRNHFTKEVKDIYNNYNQTDEIEETKKQQQQKAFYVHGLEELKLLNCPFYSQPFAQLMQFSLKSQCHSSYNQGKS